ncbi:unnamed protein product [Clonostachys rosea f. rosea IK726]|uniref:Cnl2/NKP2 family protein n=2 Tax=Bionectria ochroleuca TaxID=29856 RepID=A0A0B7K5W8_BIOOC|nr:unnamed protein product [Clonostachys rosea f. rosea IK726]
MAPTESEVLENYLLRPSSLNAIMTFEHFAERFPPAQRDNPQIRLLWRDLVAQRDKALEEVQSNIEAEATLGQAMKKELLRVKREAAKGEVDGEVELERALFGSLSGAKPAKHSLTSIIPEVDGAVKALDAEIERLKSEEAELLESTKQIIGGLSDLRYGKFANTQIKDEVLDSLTALQDVCNRPS